MGTRRKTRKQLLSNQSLLANENYILLLHLSIDGYQRGDFAGVITNRQMPCLTGQHV